jgi:hypothetical protein
MKHLNEQLKSMTKKELRSFIGNNKLMSQYYTDTLKELETYLAFL